MVEMKRHYDIQEKSEILQVLEKYEYFHDWVFERINILCDEDAQNNFFQSVDYSVIVVLCDPDNVTDVNQVSLKFSFLEEMNIAGLNSGTPEIGGLVFSNNGQYFSFHSEIPDKFMIKARKLQFLRAR